MLLCDRDIRSRCLTGVESIKLVNPMIEPFSEAVSGSGVISYGLTHAGYDLRLADEILLYLNTGEAVDPKRFADEEYRNRMFHRKIPYPTNGGSRAVVLPPGAYCLGRSVEYIRMPKDLSGTCVGKSTYARSMILVNTTPLEPGWEGFLTIEIGNVGPCPAQVYVGEGIAQLRFETLSGIPETDYDQKGGQYQKQTTVTPPRVKS